ncbi:helix-turn-helix domain-containing protein [Acinetobacter sp. YH12090]|uniref:helix-turn-helix domain-containing protein n=1 Tax=Acinetobacter sp. YH12090 TaxID=2601081 RepID=UPI0015D0F7BE|nr:helix-turn-helix domain-containing protein [Acinetobacter sp. YH12090]
MKKYLTSNDVCEMFNITKRTLNRWQIKTQWGIPFPAPVLDSVGGGMKRYLTTDVMEWEQQCQKIECHQKAV